mmetsp:Transcript_44150/g.103261  ORF Transcript_44150/g.103261 Transcript_44150/m.103261 type:complete len:215 (-) Transcript_44150:666-1310(-)
MKRSAASFLKVDGLNVRLCQRCCRYILESEVHSASCCRKLESAARQHMASDWRGSRRSSCFSRSSRSTSCARVPDVVRSSCSSSRRLQPSISPCCSARTRRSHASGMDHVNGLSPIDSSSERAPPRTSGYSTSESIRKGRALSRYPSLPPPQASALCEGRMRVRAPGASSTRETRRSARPEERPADTSRDERTQLGQPKSPVWSVWGLSIGDAR